MQSWDKIAIFDLDLQDLSIDLNLFHDLDGQNDPWSLILIFYSLILATRSLKYHTLNTLISVFPTLIQY